METNKLRHFVTIYETQHMRKAAELLSLSHSTLSKSLKTLEDELGFRLFVPAGRGLTHTAEAKRTYEKAKKILAEISSLNDISTDKGDLPVLRIGTFEVFSTYFLQKLATDLSSIHLRLHEILQGDLERSVAKASVDFGITYEPIPYPGIEFLKVTEVKMKPFVKLGAFKNAPINRVPFATPLKPVQGAPSGVRGLDGWPDHEFERIRQYQVDTMESGIELARQGLCAIFIPEFVAKLHNSVVVDEFKLVSKPYPHKMQEVVRSVYLVKRTNTTESPEMKKICKHLRSLA